MDTQNQQTQIPQGLDPTAFMLTKAIGHVETGGNSDPYNAPGKSGEYGKYQFMPETWKTWAGQYLKDENAPMTPENQNEVAYSRVNDLLKQGYKPSQVASIWNSGSPDYEGKIGKNKFGVHYNVPQYVNSVKNAYQNIQKGISAPAEPTASTVPSDPNQQPQQGGDWLDKAANIMSSIFGGRQVGEYIGAQIAKAQHPDVAQYISQPSPTQILGDVGQMALTVAMPEAGAGEGIMARLGANAAIGAGFGLTNAMKDNGDVASNVGTGAATGLALGGLGEVASKLLNVFPKWFVGNGLRGATEDTLNTALEKKFITPAGGLRQAQSDISNLNGQIENILEQPKYANVGADTENILNKTISGYTDRNGYQVKGFLNSRFTPQDLIDNAMKLDPANQLLWEKFEAGQANLREVNKLRSALDSEVKILYKRSYASAEPSIGLELGGALARSMRDYVQTAAPETQNLFGEVQKNIGLRDLLDKIVKRSSRVRGFGFRDIMSLLLGHTFGGLPGSLGMEALNRFSQSPTSDILAGRIMQRAVNPALRTGGLFGKMAALHSISNGQNNNGRNRSGSDSQNI